TAFESALAAYPWERIRAGLESGKELPGENRSAEAEERPPSSEALTFACVADEKYIPFLLGLVTNLRQVHGKLDIHLLAVDEPAARLAREALPDDALTVYRFEDLYGEA